jgi:hypothetical protein
MVGTDERVGWVEKSYRGPDLKGAGYGRFSPNPPYMVLPAAADLKSTPSNLAALLTVVVLLSAGVELHPMYGYA